MHALIQVLRVNEMRSGTSMKTGTPRQWEMQDAECLILNDDGSVAQVGVLQVPKELRGQLQPGIYTGAFALRPDLQTRRIGAVLVGLTPVPPAAFKGGAGVKVAPPAAAPVAGA